MTDCTTQNCGIASAESNRAVLRYQKEDPACQGKLLPAGVTKEMRVTNIDMEMDKKTGTSEEIRADRQISEIYALNASSKGSVDFEFASGTVDDFLASYLGGTWSSDINFAKQRGEHVAFTANNTIVVTGADITDAFASGTTIKTEGFSDVANNRYWTITASAFAAGNTTLTLAGTDAVVEAGNAFATVFNAEDVILSGTTLQCDATGFHDGAAGTIFAAARAAGKLEVGRSVYVQGLGLEEGTLTLSGLPAAEEQFTITTQTPSCDTVTTTYEYSNTGVVSLGAVKIDIGGDANANADNTAAAIVETLRIGRQLVSASAAAGVVTIRNLNIQGNGGIAGTVTNGVIVDFAGGDATVGGRYLITGATDSLLTVSPAPGTEANASAKTVIIKGSHLAPPSVPADIKKDSYHFENEFSDVGQFILYKKHMVGGVTLEASAEDIVKGSVETLGADVVPSQATVLGLPAHTQVDTLSTPIYNATSNIRSVRKDYSDLSTAIMSFSIDMKTDLRERNALGYYFPAGIGQGSLDITGKIEAYFQDMTLFNDFYNNRYVAFDFMFEDADHNSYMITLPRVFLKKDKVTPGSLNEDVVEELEYGATFDPVVKAEIVYNRFSSLVPPTA